MHLCKVNRGLIREVAPAGRLHLLLRPQSTARKQLPSETYLLFFVKILTDCVSNGIWDISS